MEVKTIEDNAVVLTENGTEIRVEVEPTQLGARVVLGGINCDLAGEAPGEYVTVDNTSTRG